ncbi:hypothetical protein [Burkholderia ubonensis]|uniref:hypothetical protein n=1 Tax=Burkholderia ubonensis TaxID=101571 RepID=UPI000B1C33D6|nr:hypothetical protein [Burkholderia ubonensis]
MKVDGGVLADVSGPPPLLAIRLDHGASAHDVSSTRLLDKLGARGRADANDYRDFPASV